MVGEGVGACTALPVCKPVRMRQQFKVHVESERDDIQSHAKKPAKRYAGKLQEAKKPQGQQRCMCVNARKAKSHKAEKPESRNSKDLKPTWRLKLVYFGKPRDPSLGASGDELRQQLHRDMEAWNTVARQRLSASRDARKRSEKDVQLLANRLRLLRAEEAKALRIIEEVRRRTREVWETRMKNEKMLQYQQAVKQCSLQAFWLQSLFGLVFRSGSQLLHAYNWMIPDSCPRHLHPSADAEWVREVLGPLCLQAGVWRAFLGFAWFRCLAS